MEGTGDGNGHMRQASRLDLRPECCETFASTADDGLSGAVEIRQPTPILALEQALHLPGIGGDRHHSAQVQAFVLPGHLHDGITTAPGHAIKSLFVDRTGGMQGNQFAVTMAGDHTRSQPECIQ